MTKHGAKQKLKTFFLEKFMTYSSFVWKPLKAPILWFIEHKKKGENVKSCLKRVVIKFI